MKKNIFAVALLLGTSIVAAQGVHTGVAEHAPAHVAEPATVPVEAPVPAPAVVETPAAPVVPDAPVVVLVAEPAPVAKPAETISATVAGTKISLYGRLELNAAYEDGITEGLWSSKAQIPAKKKDSDGKDKTITPQGRTSLSVARTRFGMNLEGPSKEDEPTVKGKLEADFARVSTYDNFNGTLGFRLRQAWTTVAFKDIGLTLLFGQTDDVVNPLDPNSINPSSLNGVGNIGNRRPQIRVTEAIGPVELAVAATHDRLRVYTADSSDNTDNAASSSPGIQGRLGLKLPATWAGEKANLSLGVGGLYAKAEAANADNDERAKRGPSANMFGADLSLPLIDILTLNGEFFTGQNLSRYEGNLGLHHIGKSRPQKVKEDGLKSTGWWGALAAKLPANLSAGAGLGMDNLDGEVKLDDKGKTDESTIIPGSAKGNMFVFANLAYNFTSAAKVTFEWLNLSTDYADKAVDVKDADGIVTGKKLEKVDSGSLNRFELNFRYDFK